MTDPLLDGRGTYVYVDRVLNLMVVIVTKDPHVGSRYGVDEITPTGAVLLADSPYSTVVGAMRNTLVMAVGRKSVKNFALPDGFAGSFHDSMDTPLVDFQDLLERVAELYNGSDREQLEEFVKEIQASGNSDGAESRQAP